LSAGDFRAFATHGAANFGNTHESYSIVGSNQFTPCVGAKTAILIALGVFKLLKYPMPDTTMIEKAELNQILRWLTDIEEVAY
jgi:hypothetical protein